MRVAIKVMVLWLTFIPMLCIANPMLSSSTKMEIYSTLFTKQSNGTCEINDGEPLIVDFGDSILASQIEEMDVNSFYSYPTNNNLAKTLKLKIVCPTYQTYWGFIGNMINKNIMTDKPNLYIYYSVDQQSVTNGIAGSVGLNSYFYIALDAFQPIGIDVDFIPVRSIGSQITGGVFNGALTLVISY